MKLLSLLGYLGLIAVMFVLSVSAQTISIVTTHSTCVGEGHGYGHYEISGEVESDISVFVTVKATFYDHWGQIVTIAYSDYTFVPPNFFPAHFGLIADVASCSETYTLTAIEE